MRLASSKRPFDSSAAVKRANLARQAGPELPVWRLGDAGGLHRRDIYDDAR
jgi:hypothetical protein